MHTDKPLVSILMAIYEPRMDWLKEQLISLNTQTYPNIRLYVRDDCSTQVSYGQIRKTVEDCITAFPYYIEHNNKNLGSNKTFERLTQEAEGFYYAYCDQDDVWLPEKLTVLQEVIERENAELVCSDMFIINEKNQQIADSITRIRRHHVFRSGYGLTDTLWYSNFASGCALLVRASIAKGSVPFNPYMYYDHYIAFCAAATGKIISLKEPLLLHREHSTNQSSLLGGIYGKEDYCRIRIDKKYHAVCWLLKRYHYIAELKAPLVTGKRWLSARRRYVRGNRSQWKTIWHYRKLAKWPSILEIVLPYLPNIVFKAVLWLGKKNIL